MILATDDILFLKMYFCYTTVLQLSDGKESVYNAGDLGSAPGLGKSPGGGHGNPLQYSCLENSHGQRSLVACRTQGLKESDMTEQLSTAQHSQNTNR